VSLLTIVEGDKVLQTEAGAGEQTCMSFSSEHEVGTE